MAQLVDHPTVKQFYEEHGGNGRQQTPSVLEAVWLRKICLDAGADDVGFVETDRPEIAVQ
jgi:hypothetical protein